MADVVTFGEAMIRLSPPNFQRLEQAVSLDVQIGGGELNVAVGVSRLGLKSAWVSRLPKNALGRLLENRARQAGVDTSEILWTDEGRLGLYFVEFGAAPRPSSVLYDRAYSSISAACRCGAGGGRGWEASYSPSPLRFSSFAPSSLTSPFRLPSHSSVFTC